MKKIAIAVIAITVLAAFAPARDLSLALTVSYLGKADSGFKEVYGSGGVLPGLRFEAALGHGLSLYASYGLFGKKGVTPVLKEECTTRQHFIAAGGAWSRELGEKLDLKLYAGLLYINYKEEALGEKVTGSAVGAELGAGLSYMLSARLFLSPFVSYQMAGDTVDETNIKLGGFQVGIGLGLRF